MKLSDDQAWARLSAHDHGVLCTVHPTRGVDAVPVAYAVADGHIGIPIDLVKPKASVRLQRERNLEADPRATMLIEHWDRDEWSRLWWVRVQLRWVGDDGARAEVLAEELAQRLAAKYPQYAGKPFVRVLVLRVEGIGGWGGG